MILGFNVKEPYREKLAAVTHVDNTGRIQSVSKEDNPRYHELIKNFGRITGVYCILNTSFNIQGQPIVRTPEDALECFIKNNMDILVLGDYVIWKN
jgi:carbamoyltransferase